MNPEDTDLIFAALPEDPEYRGTYKSEAAWRFVYLTHIYKVAIERAERQQKELARLNVQVVDQKRIITKLGRDRSVLDRTCREQRYLGKKLIANLEAVYDEFKDDESMRQMNAALKLTITEMRRVFNVPKEEEPKCKE